MVGMDDWRAKMRELAEINRELGRVYEELED
jgi:predicted ABC-class ATPase